MKKAKKIGCQGQGKGPAFQKSGGTGRRMVKTVYGANKKEVQGKGAR